MITETEYSIKEENSSFVVYKGESVASRCNSEIDSLHSIWVLENKVYDDFYVVNESGVVFRTERGSL